MSKYYSIDERTIQNLLSALKDKGDYYWYGKYSLNNLSRTLDAITLPHELGKVTVTPNYAVSNKVVFLNKEGNLEQGAAPFEVVEENPFFFDDYWGDGAFDGNYGKSYYVYADRGGIVMHSTDGVHWEKRELEYLSVDGTYKQMDYFEALVTNGEGVWVTLDSGTLFYSKDDGQTWYEYDSNTSYMNDLLSYGNGKFLCSTLHGRDKYVHVSEDGEHWTKIILPDETPRTYLTKATWCHDRYVIFAEDKELNGVMSFDGYTWEPFSIDEENPNDTPFIFYVNDEYVIINVVGNEVAVRRSPDFINWSFEILDLPMPVVYLYDGAISTDGTIVVLGDLYTQAYNSTFTLTSNGKKNWIYNDIFPVSEWFNRMMWDGEKFFTVGCNGYYMYSLDGRHWVTSAPTIKINTSKCSWKE